MHLQNETVKQKQITITYSIHSKAHTNMYNTTMGDNGIISGGNNTWDNVTHVSETHNFNAY